MPCCAVQVNRRELTNRAHGEALVLMHSIEVALDLDNLGRGQVDFDELKGHWPLAVGPTERAYQLLDRCGFSLYSIFLLHATALLLMLLLFVCCFCCASTGAAAWASG